LSIFYGTNAKEWGKPDRAKILDGKKYGDEDNKGKPHFVLQFSPLHSEHRDEPQRVEDRKEVQPRPNHQHQSHKRCLVESRRKLFAVFDYEIIK
jgi:hypothetical protein